MAAAMGWEEFRKWIAARLNKSRNTHIQHCAEIMGDVDYEGPEMFSVSCYPPHSLYEDYECQMAEVNFDTNLEWWNEEGGPAIRDWVIDMHPGLCPPEVVKAADRIL